MAAGLGGPERKWTWWDDYRTLNLVEGSIRLSPLRMNVRSCYPTCVGHRKGEDEYLTSLDDEMARSVADTMQALATPSRVRILASLTEESRSVGDLADTVGMEQSAVSHQLRILRHLRLVVGERRGRTVVYSLHDDHVAVLLDEAVSHVEHLRMGLSRASSTQPVEVRAS